MDDAVFSWCMHDLVMMVINDKSIDLIMYVDFSFFFHLSGTDDNINDILCNAVY